MRLIALALIASMAASGCATLIGRDGAYVRFVSDPDSAELSINGRSSGKTPTTEFLSPAKTQIVTVRKDGCESETKPLTTHVSWGWIAADVLTGLLPLAVDAGTGQWKTFDSDYHVFTLECEPSTASDSAR